MTHSIAEIKALRAINLAARVTMPTQPWPKGETTPMAEIATRAFYGSYNVSDIRFMALAILQMYDENHELRERVRRLEERAGSI